MKIWAVAIVALWALTACAPSPQDYAEAEKINQQTADAAAAAAQAREATAVEIEAARQTLPVRVARDAMLETAIGIAGALGLCVLVIGGAAAFVSWLHVRASVVYPNSAGQYPIVVKHNGLVGQTLVVDPSRMHGPISIIQAPNRVQARVSGSEPRVSLPIGTDHQTQARITTQTQAANLIVAATRKGADPSGRALTQPVVTSVFGGGALPPAVPEPVLLEASKVSHIERLLAEPVADDSD